MGVLEYYSGYGHGEEPSGDPLRAKIISMCGLAVGSLTIGFLPFIFHQRIVKHHTPRVQSLLSLLLCFGGGVLFSACFLHILPEVKEGITENLESGAIAHTDVSLPELIICCGFFLVYLMEEIVHKLFGDAGHGHGHGGGGEKQEEEKHPRTLSGRRRSSYWTNADEEEIEIDVAYLDQEKVNKLRSFLLVMALSFHAVLEGIAIGLEEVEEDVWMLFAAIAVHKFIIMFCMTIELVSNRTDKMVHIFYIISFGITSSIGAAIGIAISQTSPNLETPAINVLQGLAAGTLMYVAFFEIIQRERSKEGNGLLKLFAVMCGFFVLMGVNNIHHHEHGEHEHNHPNTTLAPTTTTPTPLS